MQLLHKPLLSFMIKVGTNNEECCCYNIFISIFHTVLRNERVKHHFEKIDMKKLKEHQRTFLTMAFGGPNNYKGKNMKAAHANAHVTNQDYDVIVELLMLTLKELKVGAEEIYEVNQLVQTLRNDVLNRATDNIYVKIGGHEAVDIAVDRFYDKGR